MGANRRCLAYLTVCAVLVALSTALVAFRVLLRWKRSVLGLDDYVICGSIVLAYGMFGEAVVWARDGGLGKHVVDLTMAEQIIFQKCFFANEITLTILLPSIKISILLLYHRIFFAVERFKIASFITGGLVTIWFLADFTTVLLQCRPVALNWDKSVDGTCIERKRFLYARVISNLIMDVIVLLLPLPIVLRLHLPLSQKLPILGIFLLGGFVCIASTMRVVVLEIFENQDVSYSIMDAATWAFIEPCVGIICACLPTVRPLLRLMCGPSWREDPDKTPVRTHRMRRLSSPRDASERDDGGWDAKRLRDDLALMGGSTRVTINGVNAS